MTGLALSNMREHHHIVKRLQMSIIPKLSTTNKTTTKPTNSANSTSSNASSTTLGVVCIALVAANLLLAYMIYSKRRGSKRDSKIGKKAPNTYLGIYLLK